MPAQLNLQSDNAQAQRGSRRPLLFVLLILVLLFVITYASRLGEYRRLLGQEVSMQYRIEDAEARGRELVSELEDVKSQEYTEKMAVMEFGMARPNDQVLTVIDAPPAASQPASEQSGIDQDRSHATVGESVGGTARDVGLDVAQTDAEPTVWRQWLSVFRSQSD